MELFPTFPLLEHWYFAHTSTNSKDTYEDIESKLVVVGNVYNHPGFKDGELIKSAPIKKADLDRGLIKTSDKTYMLGKPKAQWVEWLQETKQDLEINKFLERIELRN